MPVVGVVGDLRGVAHYFGLLGTSKTEVERTESHDKRENFNGNGVSFGGEAEGDEAAECRSDDDGPVNERRPLLQPSP